MGPLFFIILGMVWGGLVVSFIQFSNESPVIVTPPPEYSIKMDESCYDQIVNNEGKIHIVIHKDL